MIRKPQFFSLIRQGDFSELFITELGWNRYRGHAQLPTILVDDKEYNITAIAERNGFQVLLCIVDEIPTQSVAKKIDTKLRRQALDYICIYRLADTAHDLWVVPVRSNEKRDLVLVEYDNANAEVLYQKIDGFTFDLDEETNIVDLRNKVQSAFAVNSEKITKDFYAGFKKQHKAFAEFITGIDDHIEAKNNRNKQWYTSVMLNRLMFCYFIQKKGFLALDTDYLRNKLNWVRANEGEDQFFNFYRSFLRRLFHDGLNTPRHSRDFEEIFGKIPYLNGGMFDEHQLERDYADIDIPDDAFIGLFDFFDKWNWHLDTRLTASGKDINPDVLGYIFEQYINDRAQMGAYYTKEDITEYIGRNCILPYLFDAVKSSAKEAANDFAPDGYVWRTLRESDDLYIFDAVKKGHDTFDQIPENIAKGIITPEMRHEYSETPVGELPENHIPLAELRQDWNTKTPDAWGLPNEIWRESIERIQRCDDILGKINRGEITSINDFITYNLDIRSFASDLLSNGDSRFVGRFYHALQKVTILDPTCGSGAFLFAAMNILEPLYEICIDRMQDFNHQNPAMFKAEFDEITDKYRSNIQYFIFKSIILRNLYGVDIMVEATEIAKLRLFLKMVAVVEVDRRADNLGLDPLPDIDFNIRCGNTLVGYANKEQLDKDLSYAEDFLQEIANQEFKEHIDEEMQKVAAAYAIFKDVQLRQSEDMVAFKQAKKLLRDRLVALNDKLNQRLFLATTGHVTKQDDVIVKLPQYKQWMASHQPFHWLAEFYQIISGNGGFDVIIGNPPYVTQKKKDLESINQPKVVVDSGNLYSAVVHRCRKILNKKASFGMIVPISFISTSDHKGVRNFVENNHRSYYSSYDIRPAHLFDGAAQRLTIFINIPSNETLIYSEKQLRWYSENRDILFNTIVYNLVSDSENGIYRTNTISSNIINDILSLSSSPEIITGKDFFWMATTANNFIKAINKQPRYSTNGIKSEPSGWRTILCSRNTKPIVIPIVNSSLFYYIWKCSSDGFNVTKGFVTELIQKLYSDIEVLRIKLYDELLTSLERNSETHVRNQKTTGRTEIQLFRVKPVKPIIDKIDTILAHHYGFTDEELDFIINYDIKYRMGDELNAEE